MHPRVVRLISDAVRQSRNSKTVLRTWPEKLLQSKDGSIVVVTNLNFFQLPLTTLRSFKRTLECSKCPGFTLEDSKPLKTS
ncbi:unnamed protein product [Caenorhabditis nigoni]